ncbi:MAG: PRC-barrel domain-containing protein [Candidatus Sulfopaludibacter sp.]|nr:PRC-barrel domain-containing protein [Candidatus Sulfopaludibacter sp.]
MRKGKRKPTDPGDNYRQVMAASTLNGESVRNDAGEDLGTVDEIMIDIPSGRVAYAVLSFGGVLGLGSKLFAVPWNALQVDEDEKCFVLNVDKATLDSAPGFDKNNWPDMADTTFRSQIFRHYGAEPYWEEEYPERKTLGGGGGL